MNQGMGGYSAAGPQFTNPGYKPPPMPESILKSSDDKKDDQFDAFDPFNPKPKTQTRKYPQQQQAQPQKPQNQPQQPNIQIIEEKPKKADLNAFRSAFQSEPPISPQQNNFGYQMNAQMNNTFSNNNNMTPGMNNFNNSQFDMAQSQNTPGFNFSGQQNTQMSSGFNFGSQFNQQTQQFNQQNQQFNQQTQQFNQQTQQFNQQNQQFNQQTQQFNQQNQQFGSNDAKAFSQNQTTDFYNIHNTQNSNPQTPAAANDPFSDLTNPPKPQTTENQPQPLQIQIIDEPTPQPNQIASSTINQNQNQNMRALFSSEEPEPMITPVLQPQQQQQNQIQQQQFNFGNDQFSGSNQTFQSNSIQNDFTFTSSTNPANSVNSNLSSGLNNASFGQSQKTVTESNDDPFSSFNPIASAKPKDSEPIKQFDTNSMLTPSTNNNTNLNNETNNVNNEQFTFTSSTNTLNNDNPFTNNNFGFNNNNSTNVNNIENNINNANPFESTFKTTQSGSNGGIPSLNNVNDLFGGSPQNQPPAAKSANPFMPPTDLFGASSQNQENKFNPFAQQQGSTGGSPFSSIAPNNDPNPFTIQSSQNENPFMGSSIPQQQGSNGAPATPTSIDDGISFIQPTQSQQQGSIDSNPFSQQTSSKSSFADAFRQAVSESDPQPQFETQPTLPQTTEGQQASFGNTSMFGQSAFGQQPSFGKQTEDPSTGGFTFAKTDENQNINFQGFTFSGSQQQTQQPPNFGFDQQTEKPTENAENSQSQPFNPFGMTELRPMSNLTFVIDENMQNLDQNQQSGVVPEPESAIQTNPSNIPYFVEEERKKAIEERIKNDNMSAFDPFNPNPQPQKQQPQQQPEVIQQFNQPKQHVEPIQASIKASVTDIRNMFGGPEDESEQNQPDKPDSSSVNSQPEISPNPFQNTQIDQNNEQQGSFDGNSGSPFGDNSSPFGLSPELQNPISASLEPPKDTQDMSNLFAPPPKEISNPFATDGEVTTFGSSPQANPFGGSFSTFGSTINQLSNEGFANAFSGVENPGKAATFADFFPTAAQQPQTPSQPEQNPFMNSLQQPTPQQQEQQEQTTNAFPQTQQQQSTQPPNVVKADSAQNQQKVDDDNPFGPGSSFSMFGTVQQTKEEPKPAENTKPSTTSFDIDNPFAPSNENSIRMFNQENESKPEAPVNPIAAPSSAPATPDLDLFDFSMPQTSQNIPASNSGISPSNIGLDLFSSNETKPVEPKKESFNPFASGQSNPFNPFAAPPGTSDPFKSSTMASQSQPQTSEIKDPFSASHSVEENTEPDFCKPQQQTQAQRKPQNQPQPASTRPPERHNGKKDVFDDFPSNPDEIDNTLPEKPPPFILPTIEDNGDNPFAVGGQPLNSNPFAPSSSSSNSNPFATSPSPNSNPFASSFPAQSDTTNNITPANESNPFANSFASENNEVKNVDENSQKKVDIDNPFADFGGAFGGSSTKPATEANTENPFGDLSNAFGQQTEKKPNEETQKTDLFSDIRNSFTQQNEIKEEKEPQNQSQNESNQETVGNPFSGFTFGQTNSSNEQSQTVINNSGFNPFGMVNPEQNQKASKTEPAASSETTDDQQQQPNQKEEQNIPDLFDVSSEPQKIESNSQQSSTPSNTSTDTIGNVTNDDIFGFSLNTTITKNSPVSSSHSDFYNFTTEPISSSPTAPMTSKSTDKTFPTLQIGGFNPFGMQNNTTSNIIESSEEEPTIEDSPMTNILKSFVKPIENGSYYSYERDPQQVLPFPKFEQTQAAEILANFVKTQFGITPTFASTYQKQQNETDVSSFFSATTVVEPDDNDDFLLMI
ncbi:hypothetical protein TRFO_39047 [Tritrichomonas foetus]|uniref:Uncharacterized protein n=1 Tax=Tritrichomonas foetus TaxID=1144522 RepID=A0A1J4JAV7_9EUKA|nr:hypothetical protein TRFO_39047 [Tritrichomonas foetus]|eukprot:OHS94787.1 hypothetical protein TRFO_39047 [Tritrichomonas foetus]